MVKSSPSKSNRGRNKELSVRKENKQAPKQEIRVRTQLGEKIILVLTPPTAQFWLRNQQSLSRSARNSRLSADGPAQWLC